MKLIKPLTIAILFSIGSSGLFLAAEDQGPISFNTAKELGRTKSQFLHGREAESKSVPAVPQANLKFFGESVGPVLRKSCMTCHGPDISEGRLRVDQLNPNLLDGTDIDKWREIYNVLSNSEMPPDDDPDYALADGDRRKIVDWLSEELNKASLARRNDRGHSSFRRLTKYEYDYALQDLLGLPFPLADKLPPETASDDGFKNSSDLLQMSPMQFETYREIGLTALKRAIVIGERPTPVRYVIAMQEEMTKDDSGERNRRNRLHLLDRETGERASFPNANPKPIFDRIEDQTPPTSPVVLVLPRNNELKLNLDRFLPDDGMMRVRIRAGRSNMNQNEFASLRLIFSAHTSNNANFSQVISERDIPVTAPAEEPQFIDFDIPLSDIQRNPFRKLTTTFPRRDEFLHIQNVSNAGGGEDSLQVFIDHIEIVAPFYEQWPPPTHTNLFIESGHCSDEDAYGREVLTRFLRRVWRRPASAREIDQFMELFAEYRTELSTFEEAMLEVLATALATPEFLYLTQREMVDANESPTRLSDWELASRLSFFLWTSVPDDQLLSLAEQGKLSEPEVLTAQVERMLADPRASRFSQHFVQQWLGLDGLNSVTHISDDSLRDAMQEEPIAFFAEALAHNRSVMDFIHSDYAMLNERLAVHYRIPGVYGPHFRKVLIDDRSNRGGVLTSAAMLSMNSDGKDSHPLNRGVWMLERILHDPPPPPPPNVPDVDLTDPEILKMTLKERIADHRNKPACISCHSRIDPWGIAFENYDALGAYRTQIENKPVDATAQLFNKQTLAGMDGLKRYLLTDRQDQLARAMVHKMTAYALGRPLSFADHADIDRLTAQFRQEGDGLRDLIHLIVSSDLFLSK